MGAVVAVPVELVLGVVGLAAAAAAVAVWGLLRWDRRRRER